MSSPKSSPRFRFTGAAILMTALVFLVPALQNGNPVLYLLSVLIPGIVFLAVTVLARMFSLDRMILTVTLYLCSLGIASLGITDSDAALAQAFRCGVSLFVLLVGGVLIRSLTPSLLTSGCSAFLGLLMLAGKLLSPALSLPLTEAALALLLISFSSLLTRQGPVPAAVLGLAAMTLLLLLGEAGFSLLGGIAILLLLFAGDGRPVIVLPVAAAAIFLFFGALRLFPVRIPDQSIPSLGAVVSSGLVGSDVLPDEIMALNSASLFPGITGHYGLIFAGLTVLLFLPLSLRGTSVAAASRSRFHAILAMGITLMQAMRSLAAALSLFGFSFFPVPGIPFLTSSLPDLCAQLFLVGILCGISGCNDADLAEDAHLAMLAK